MPASFCWSDREGSSPSRPAWATGAATGERRANVSAPCGSQVRMHMRRGRVNPGPARPVHRNARTGEDGIMPGGKLHARLGRPLGGQVV